MDLIRRHICILDYQGMEGRIILKEPSLPNDIGLTLLNAPNINSISIPARFEVIRQVNQSNVEDVFVPQQILENSVNIANTITSKSQPLVRIINCP